MKFRKLYWTTEQIAKSGESSLTGIYTSIPDLHEIGLNWVDGISQRDGFRIGLYQLDVCGKPLGSWSSPEFAGMTEDLAKFVKTDDFNQQDCDALVLALKAFCATATL